MKDNGVVVNSIDKARLLPHLAGAPAGGPADRLRAVLERAEAVPPRRVPRDVVTMNSRLRVRDPRDNAAETYVLTYPDRSSPGAVSVLSPLGAALLGAREGEATEFMGARTARRVIVEHIEYQPERAGDYQL